MEMAQDLNLQEVLGQVLRDLVLGGQVTQLGTGLEPQVETNQTVDMSAFALEAERPPGPDLWMPNPPSPPPTLHLPI